SLVGANGAGRDGEGAAIHVQATSLARSAVSAADTISAHRGLDTIAIAPPAAGGAVASDRAAGKVQGAAAGVQAATNSRAAGAAGGGVIVVPAGAADGLVAGDRGPRNC